MEEWKNKKDKIIYIKILLPLLKAGSLVRQIFQ